MFPKRVGTHHGVRIYESKKFGSGRNSGGIALPGYGIIVGLNTFSKKEGLPVVAHEFGHFLQFRKVGWFWFYLVIGPLSLLSAWTNWHGRGHQCYWIEQWANHLAAQYFGKKHWPHWRFPCQDVEDRTKFWMGC